MNLATTKPNEAEVFSKQSRSSSNGWNRRKPNGGGGHNGHSHNGHENGNWRSRQGKPRSHGNNWQQGERSNGVQQHCDRHINKKKEVIIYYNDPKVTDHVVQEMIENVAKEPSSLGSDKENNLRVKSKSPHKPKSVNGKAHSKTPQAAATSHKDNARATKTDKVEGPAPSGQPPAGSSVTIYYGASSVGASQEDHESAANILDGKDASNKTVTEDKSATASKEEKTVKTTEKAESLQKPVPKSAIVEPKVIEFKPSSNSDPNDVITGGMPIPPPSLPWSSEQPEKLHRLACTLVSHPGHFYIRFDNADDAKQLASLDEFYNSDEAIELTVDVLRPGQYFAVRRIQPSSSRREWVRAQLLHIESADMLNCLLIDEGCFGVFRLADLQPLYSPFRGVPKQAIRAEIQGKSHQKYSSFHLKHISCPPGIAPPESAADWLPKQALQFKSLVSDRPLYARLDENGHRKQLESGHRLQLDLVFGQSEEEAGEKELCGRSVASVLVERGLAIAKANNNTN